MELIHYRMFRRVFVHNDEYAAVIFDDGEIDLEKAKISVHQLYVLVVFYVVVSAIIIAFGVENKQDAWMTALTGMLGGIVLFLMNYTIYSYYPGHTFGQIIERILGKPLGKVVTVMYVIYFLYIAAFVLRDFGELVRVFAYPRTPLLLISSFMLIAILYTVYKGIEVIARTGEIFFTIISILGVIGMTLLLSSGNVDIHNLMPVLEKGWMPIIFSSYHSTVFPFGELIAFMMLYPYLESQKHTKRAVITGIFFGGVVISLVTMLNIAILGVDLFTRTEYPLLTTFQLVEGKAFLERMDSLFMVTSVLGGFFRISILFYATLMCATTAFSVPNYRTLVLPLGVVLLYCSVNLAGSFTEFIVNGMYAFTYYIQLPMQIIIPLILLIVGWFRTRRKGNPT